MTRSSSTCILIRPVQLCAPRLPYADTRKQALVGQKTRYLGGQVVTTKGEKKIETNPKEDWDGGSRGRVKTKGKRGAGGVSVPVNQK